MSVEHETNKKRLIIGSFLVMSLFFTLAYTTSTEAHIEYERICQGDSLIKTYGSNITTDDDIRVVSLDRDPIDCRFGCTNNTFPAQCIRTPDIDGWGVVYTPLLLYVFMFIFTMTIFLVGMIYRTEDETPMPFIFLFSMALFFVLALLSGNIEGHFHFEMMILNIGFGMVSLIMFFVGTFWDSFSPTVKKLNQGQDFNKVK